jgi:DNA-binding XRE family transcriptional regulator/quercetin dioxygenase-like cupin family protein
MAGNSEIDAEVGRALYRLRHERSMTVTELATQAGVSVAMISRIENGNVSPSLNTLQSLAQALSVSIMSFFSNTERPADVHHVRAGSGLPSRRLTDNHAHDYLLLGKHGGIGGTFQSARIQIERGSSGTLPRYQHEGYVFIYLIKGKALYSCESETFEMAVGDTLSFDAKLTHGFSKIHSKTVDFLTVSTRPD